jgi:hypothetical protein
MRTMISMVTMGRILIPFKFQPSDTHEITDNPGTMVGIRGHRIDGKTDQLKHELEEYHKIEYQKLVPRESRPSKL